MSARLLLVEDNEANADMLSRRLHRQGFDVLLASDGLQAVDVATSAQPDLVLMDISLPEIDGWEATQRLKGAAATAAIPIIALTAHAMVADRQKCLDAGCNEFETKPIDLKRLLAKIHALLGARTTP
jgi:CheY-like chemotaxis protein